MRYVKPEIRMFNFDSHVVTVDGSEVTQQAAYVGTVKYSTIKENYAELSSIVEFSVQ